MNSVYSAEKFLNFSSSKPPISFFLTDSCKIEEGLETKSSEPGLRNTENRKNLPKNQQPTTNIFILELAKKSWKPVFKASQADFVLFCKFQKQRVDFKDYATNTHYNDRIFPNYALNEARYILQPNYGLPVYSYTERTQRLLSYGFFLSVYRGAGIVLEKGKQLQGASEEREGRVTVFQSLEGQKLSTENFWLPIDQPILPEAASLAWRGEIFSQISGQEGVLFWADLVSFLSSKVGEETKGYRTVKFDFSEESREEHLRE